MIREKLFSVVIEVTLDQNDGGTLVTAAGGQVAQRTDQVGQAAGSGALRSHITGEVVILGTDGVLNGFLQSITAQVSEVVVSAVVITEDVDAVPSSTNSLLNFAAYVCAVEPA